MGADSEFEAMFTAHYRDVARFIARRVNPDGVADVAAEVFLTAWRRWDSSPVGAERIWLLTIAHRVLANEYRRQARANRLIDRIQREGAPTSVEGPDDADAMLVREVLASLTWPDQEALRLTYWDGFDSANAARVAGCTATAFRVRLHRARQRFERALARSEAADTAQPHAARSGRPR